MTSDKYSIPIKERACLIIERTLDVIRKNVPAFQRYINKKANNKYNITFIPNASNSSINDVFSEYHFTDIQPSDIVLDIGANVGGFSLFMSRFVNHVYAIEPILNKVLESNIRLNNINNVTVYTIALGEGMLKLTWEGCNDIFVIGKSLSSIIKDYCKGHIDFLKLDCEGAEWSIKPSDLTGIRRIEAEIHNFDGKHPTTDFLKILDEANFSYEYTSPRAGLLQVHAYAK